MAGTNAEPTRVVESKKVWTTLITNTKYLSGLLTLDYSLKQQKSAYPLVALYTETFPPEGLEALKRRKIPFKKVIYLLPSVHKDYSNDARFYDCWSKLTPFSLTEYDRVVQLDSDMLVLQNMDELMELELDDPSLGPEEGKRVFAASHACACNPLKKAHYPKDWVPENCAFTTQHDSPDEAQSQGAPCNAGFGMVNGGLQVVNPSQALYDAITAHMSSSSSIEDYEFADQSLLSDLFKNRWVPLPYVYNALKTLRWKGVHDAIWRDDRVKNVHYILSPKPWDEEEGAERGEREETHRWWWDLNRKRLDEEKKAGIEDGF
ncbi:hypothetical protein MMC25_005436 [Agyrium rufum]|nr:hypothetical protein [Agyrium rufum]